MKKKKPPVSPADEVVLEGLLEGPYDSQLNASSAPADELGSRKIPVNPYDIQPDAGPARAAASHRKPDSSGRADQPGTPPPGDEERLLLPRGAWIAMRMSGGFKFSSREIVVYRDGRVTDTSSGIGKRTGTRATRKLTDAQLAELGRLLEQANIAELPAVVGRQNPDAFAYEIAARIGRRIKTVEVFEGSIPESLAPLIRQLRQLISPDE
jgi:hypothetical protein